MMIPSRLCSLDVYGTRRTISGTTHRICGALLFMVCLLLLGGCRVERPKEILSPSQMEDVLYDFHLAQIMGSDLNSENSYKRPLYLEYVYKKHQISREQLDSSLVWYARYPKNLATIYERLERRADVEIERIKRMQEKAELRGPKPVEGDSADIWYDRRLVMLTPLPLSNRISYSIPTDSNFHFCDILEWTFDVCFFPRNTVWEEVLDALTAAVTDSLTVDSLAADTLVFDTQTLDSLPTGLSAAGALTVDSLVADSLLTDTLTADLLPMEEKPRRRAKAIASLVLRYSNDSTVAVDRVLADDASVRITLQNTDSVRLSSVYVSIYFKSYDKSDRVVLYNNSLTRYRYVAPPRAEVPDSLLIALPDSLTTDSLPADSLLTAATADTLPTLTAVDSRRK